MKPLNLIVAMTRKGVIGKDGALPWPRIPEDMKHFREKTMGHTIIMGRKTYDSIGKALPGRRNIVLSRQPHLEIDGCSVAPTIHDALWLARQNDEEPFVIGGAEIYALAMPLATRIYIIRIDEDYEGDTFFPSIGDPDWGVSEMRQGVGMQFQTIERCTTAT